MAENSSSSDSLLLPQSSMTCFFNSPINGIVITFLFIHFLLFLPIGTVVFHHGLQQWRKRRSSSSAPSMSHADVFTYSSLTMELSGVGGCLVLFCGIFTKNGTAVSVGRCWLYFIWNVQNFFHMLTCVERYLAVVHPIIYRSLKTRKGIRIRNASIACVGLLCFALTLGMNYSTSAPIFIDVSMIILSLVLISVCNVSIIRVLVRPGPGKQDGNRQRVDQSKQRAFYTVLAILVVLVVRFSCNLSYVVISVLGQGMECRMLAADIWLNLPSSLLLPLLFLHKEGKLPCSVNWRRTNNV